MRWTVLMQVFHHRKEERNSVLWRRSFSEFVQHEEGSFSHGSEEERSASEVLRKRRLGIANAVKEERMHDGTIQQRGASHGF